MQEKESNNILNVQDALNALSEVSELFKIQVWVPSKKQNYSFKEIDAKQQKDLLSAAMDDNVYNLDFVKTFYNILKENLLEKDKSEIDNLLVVDKIAIALGLRMQISPEILVVFDEKNKISEKVKLSSIVEKFKNYECNFEKNAEIKNDKVDLKAKLTYPTIKKELDYDLFFGKSSKKASEVKTSEDVQKIISEAFLAEISKYIDSIIINQSEINLNQISFDQKVKVIEKLPSALIQKILEIISQWKASLDEVLTVKHQNYSKAITIDSMLFLS